MKVDLFLTILVGAVLCYLLFRSVRQNGQGPWRPVPRGQSTKADDKPARVADPELLENGNAVEPKWHDAMQDKGFDPHAEGGRDKVMALSRAKRPVASQYRYQPPIIVRPAARGAANIAVDGTSWFGGLPSLGEQAWPASRDGSPMHPAAQIDLTEFASISMPDGFPKTGSLAFFVDLVDWPYLGKVVYVPHVSGEPTQPDVPLPRLFMPVDKMHYGMDGYAAHTAPRQFTRWPITFTQLDIVEDIDDDEDSPIYEALKTQFPDADERYYPAPETYDKASPTQGTASRWDTAQRFADMMSNAPAWMPVRIALANKMIAYHPTALAELNKQGAQIEKTSRNNDETDEAFDERVQALRAQHEKRLSHQAKRLEDSQDKIRYLTDTLPEFMALVQEANVWAYAHDRWDRMNLQDVARLNDYIGLVKKPLGDEGNGLHLFMGSNPHLHVMVNQTMQAMVQAPDEIYRQLPEAYRHDFETKGCIARSGNHHQMFGLSLTTHGVEEHRGDYLLLKLGRDCAVNWHWGDENLYFWISPEDLKNQEWDKVTCVSGRQ